MRVCVSVGRHIGWDSIARSTVDKISPFGLDISPLQNKFGSKAKKVDQFLKFSFQMDSIILNLFTG